MTFYKRYIGNMVCAGADGNPSGLKEYFIQHGLEVVDNRSTGGALWVVGSRAQIGSIVSAACNMYHAGGRYMEQGGKAVHRRPAWFTKCGR